MKPELIPEWPRAWRMLSVQIAALAVAFGAMPPDMQASVLEMLGVPLERVPAILGLTILVARLVNQPSVREE